MSADIPPRLAKLVGVALGLASTALAGTVAVAIHCIRHGALG